MLMSTAAALLSSNRTLSQSSRHQQHTSNGLPTINMFNQFTTHKNLRQRCQTSETEKKNHQ
ncbi:AAEL002923-PA [Aedes aegypti]|uniref:AAEL002923-PA n=1 Tax=Aedes aegypti TaxID=7159 RepID=Q17GQ8_AEDAE|nr:AAEL002923-PA [Aedes aegypti]